MIKNLIAATCLLSVSILISGCSATKDSEGITKEGLCTEATVNVYNSIMTNQSLYSQADITTLESKCANYYRLIGSSSCKAMKMMTGADLYISASTVDPVCKVALSTAKERSQPTASYSTCSNSVESSFSVIRRYLEYYKTSGSISDAMVASRECSNFRNLDGPSSCYTSSGKYINHSAVVLDCSVNDDAISKYYNSKPTNPGTIAPIGGEKQIDDLKTVIRLTANDAQTLSVALVADTPIQDGKTGYERHAEKASCRLQGLYGFENGKSVALPKIEKQVSKIIMKSVDEKLVITCEKEPNYTSIGWTVSDLQKIFGDSATISSIE